MTLRTPLPTTVTTISNVVVKIILTDRLAPRLAIPSTSL
jgi:hypothetical protein